MSNDTKYYTPSIEEFHVGFEFEVNCDNDWIKESLYSNEQVNVLPFMNTNNIRVKYLDKEDIESLGLKYNDLTRNFETTIQGRTDTSIFEYWLDLREFKENIGWRVTIDGEDNENSFNGIIKNKSELKRLLKQLGIYE